MAITSFLANVSCTSLDKSAPWYETLFGRKADHRPMPGLMEWYAGKAGFQLFEEPDNAGSCTVTVAVDDVRQQYLRLNEAGFGSEPIQQANYTTIFQLRDPDGNRVVLAQAGKV